PTFKILRQCCGESKHSRTTLSLTSITRKALIAHGFAGAAHVVTALQPAIAEQNGLDTRSDDGFVLFDRVTGLFKHRNGVWRNAALELELIGFPLVVNAGKVDGILNVHLKIDDVEDHLQDSGDDAGAARSAQDEERLAVFQNDGGSHCGKWT